MKNRYLYVKLQHDGTSVHGKVNATGSYAFHKEALLTVIESIAKAHVMSPKDLIVDLYHKQGKDDAAGGT